RTDADGQVFENGRVANNTAEKTNLWDVMPAYYADLVVSSVQVPGPAFSGQPLDVHWRVTNQGIGTTSNGDWVDQVFLSRDPQGTNLINPDNPYLFTHFGLVGVNGLYDRVGRIQVPDGLSGTFYAVVT